MDPENLPTVIFVSIICDSNVIIHTMAHSSEEAAVINIMHYFNQPDERIKYGSVVFNSWDGLVNWADTIKTIDIKIVFFPITPKG